MANIWRRSPSFNLTGWSLVNPQTELVADDFFESTSADLRGAAPLATGITADLATVPAALLTGDATITTGQTGYLVKFLLPAMLMAGTGGGYTDDDHLSIDLLGYTDDNQWPPLGTLPLEILVGEVTSNLPVTMTPLTLNGWIADNINTDWYHRIHLIPKLLAFGDMATPQQGAVTVWNAYLVDKVLASITEVDTGGVVLSEPVVTPGVVKPLRLLSYTLDSSLDGPSILDATYTWNFEGDSSAVLSVTGRRIIAWPFVPDWASGVLERLAWLTNILRSPTLVEQRRALRLSPRRELEARFLVHDADRQFFDMSIWGWGARTWALPLFHDVQLLVTAADAGEFFIACSTSDREFASDTLALLRGATPRDVEVVEVDSVTPTGVNLKRPLIQNWPAGTRLYPARPAVLADMPQLTRITDRACVAPAVFKTEPRNDFTGTAPTLLYRGWPVFVSPPEESEDLTAGMQRLLLELDNQTGVVARKDLSGRVMTAQSHRWVMHGRAERAAFRGLLYFLQGRFKALWVPTFSDDLTITAPAGASSTTITVANIGYTRYGGGPGRRDIHIKLRNGATIQRRILSAVELDAQAEVLTVDSALGVAFNPADVSRVSWLALCRLEQDNIELLHETDVDGVGQCQLIFRSVFDEL